MRSIMKCVLFILASVASGVALATDIGGVASQITSNFGGITNLVTGGSYIAGLAFAVGSIMKFKQHKDNPTQIPIGTPIALLFIAAALLFFPSILSTTGATLFGSSGGSVAGPSGCTIGSGGGCS